MDIDAFFPQSYDLSDLKSEEAKDFFQDFKFSQAIAFLKQVLTMSAMNLSKNVDRVIISLSICDKRIKAL